ncbi:hypothetical protein EVAR_51990_1 [Eumeta japonica]|uniref:Uncharacterized protein n=1 Tax=Eumeta variegata TaxID=151549 RepID=A0A4C1Y5Y7_EUMVA|nr:hypothetical protein EVAR_51990_1 [Eumeta japonica]
MGRIARKSDNAGGKGFRVATATWTVQRGRPAAGGRRARSGSEAHVASGMTDTDCAVSGPSSSPPRRSGAGRSVHDRRRRRDQLPGAMARSDARSE